MNIFYHYGYMGEVFQFFCRKTSSRIARAELYVSTRKFEGKHFFEKIVCVLFFFRNEPKRFGLLAKLFRQGCENCFWYVHNIIMRNFFRKNLRYFLALSHTEKNLFGIQLKIPCRVVRKHENTKLFFNHFRTLSEKFSFFDKKSSRAAKTIFYVFTGTVWKN